MILYAGEPLSRKKNRWEVTCNLSVSLPVWNSRTIRHHHKKAPEVLFSASVWFWCYSLPFSARHQLGQMRTLKKCFVRTVVPQSQSTFLKFDPRNTCQSIALSARSKGTPYVVGKGWAKEDEPQPIQCFCFLCLENRSPPLIFFCFRTISRARLWPFCISCFLPLFLAREVPDSRTIASSLSFGNAIFYSFIFIHHSKNGRAQASFWQWYLGEAKSISYPRSCFGIYSGANACFNSHLLKSSIISASLMVVFVVTTASTDDFWRCTIAKPLSALRTHSCQWLIYFIFSSLVLWILEKELHWDRRHS